MWICKANREGAKMKKREFNMGDEKITEYTSGHEATIIKNNEDTQDIPCVDASKHIESQDTTMGFYSDSELASSEMVYNFSNSAKKFIEDLKIFRYQRQYLIRRIADIYNSNNCYGLTTTRMWIICRDDIVEDIINEYKISKAFYYILADAILLELADEFNRVENYKYTELMRYPDRLFYDWDRYTDAEEYKFYDVRKLDDNLDNAVFKIRCMKFVFDEESSKHIQLGVNMYSSLHDNSVNCKNVDFKFDSTSIVNITDNLDKINMIKGSY